MKFLRPFFFLSFSFSAENFSQNSSMSIQYLTIVLMKIKLTLLIFLLLSIAQSQHLQTKHSPCPPSYQIGSVVSARISIAEKTSLVPLIREQDVQCYNYSLPYQFLRVPEVAISIHDFTTEKSDDLFFSIKPVKSESLSFVPLLVRTQWKYTRWTKISFSLLVQDRSDMEIGYYQVDSGSLGGCETGKNIMTLLPFRTIGLSGNINHKVFLHGFEISTQEYAVGAFSPYQIQILQTATNSSGITIVLSVTSITQVHAIHVSYVIWGQTDLNIVSGDYSLENRIGGQISHIPETNIGRNYARIHGITGFIINHKSQESLNFQTIWTGTKFIFEFDISQPFIQYLSYQYVFFIGSECSNCPGFPFTFNGTCVQYCPEGYYATDREICITCGQGHYWNGTNCIILCPEGQFLNTIINECECPVGSHWNGARCISCLGGRIFNAEKGVCQCPSGTIWNGYGCAEKQLCKDGKQWNIFKFICQCPQYSYWNGTYCVKRISCKNGMISDGKNGCQCPKGTYWNGRWCQTAGCVGGQVWNQRQKRCQCETGYNFNGTLCLLCINGQEWNDRNKSCECPPAHLWNGNYCEKKVQCTGNRIYNEQYKQCICKSGSFWNGYSCMVRPQCCCGQIWNEATLACNCPEGFQYDGHNCVLCINGESWDPSQKKCVCREGTQWNGKFCVVVQDCNGGSVWNQNTWSCECPLTSVWNGNYCIQNSCDGGRVWDNLQRKCICTGRQIFAFGRCILPEYLCINNKVWDGIACVCPPRTYESNGTCYRIPYCQANQVWVGINKRCECVSGFVWVEAYDKCGDPTCPEGERWNGFGCVKISCPPNSYYNGTECVCPPEDKCRPWEVFDGVKCIFIDSQCPENTQWNGTFCNPILGNCPPGFYGDQCLLIPQKCVPPSSWVNNKCQVQGFNCPKNTYGRQGNCLPYIQCQNGQTWNTDLINCVCPQGTEWNGNKCIACSGGKRWQPFVGCVCPTGYFFAGARCQRVNNLRCHNIPNAFWDGVQCVCHEGFQVVGMQCVCQSNVIVGNRCERCAHKINSEWKYGACRCKPGYTQYDTECLPNQVGSDSPDECNVGTFYDEQQKRCLPCPQGCLSCQSSYVCLQCRPQFSYDVDSELCIEFCGDGKKFVVECDDGNNDAGDGCSIDCRVEPGYTCRGGSPNHEDDCTIYQPSQLTIIQTGYIRYKTKIIVNIKLDYLPKALIQSSDCQNECSNVLDGRILSGDKAVSIRSSFIAGTSYSFSMEVEFGKEYIGVFELEVKVNDEIGRKYFSGVGLSNGLVVEVNPAYLSLAEEDRL